MTTCPSTDLQLLNESPCWKHQQPPDHWGLHVMLQERLHTRRDLHIVLQVSKLSNFGVRPLQGFIFFNAFKAKEKK